MKKALIITNAVIPTNKTVCPLPAHVASYVEDNRLFVIADGNNNLVDMLFMIPEGVTVAHYSSHYEFKNALLEIVEDYAQMSLAQANAIFEEGVDLFGKSTNIIEGLQQIANYCSDNGVSAELLQRIFDTNAGLRGISNRIKFTVSKG